ncbi:HAMP domain-containing protein [Nonomuraea cavernae]|uniref:Circadian input-output histidine kinase CikA n=1 Tax=Nonomuraea cavernae TaxID=2045107 RepID=A0A918DFS3_9ACTN|nr:HAMP domain-containing protein [Nonomuraea cavernae]MCA2183649.1 HAMP domain-containing protein [Nonomuraea cavernae]GGO60937.1 histidine kinase [Nonomuraea cavernae]
MADSARSTPNGTGVGEAELRQLLAGLTAVRDGDFRTRLPADADGLLGEIASVFNGMVDQLSLFTSEVTRVAREVGTEGQLGGQADVPSVSGTWKDLTESVNAMAGNLTGQVRSIAQVTTAVAKGDLSQKITVDARGEILELKNTVNTMVDQLSSFAAEVTRVAREVGTEGQLGGQADVKGVAGTWRDLTDSVNFMASNLTGQVRNISQVATAVAKGDLSQKITVSARGEILELKNTLNTMVDQLSSFADEVTRVAREVGTDGRLGGQADVKGVSGTWKALTESVNVMADNLTAQVRSIAQVTTAVAKGDLTQKIRVDARGEIMELKETINTMVDQLSAFADEVTRVAREVGTEGNLGGQATVRGVSGTWKNLTDNVNSMADNLTNQVRSIAQVTTAVAKGDLTRKIDVDARGEILELKTTINTMVDQLSSFAAEVTRVAREVGSEGRLGGQAEVEGVSGTWKRLTENVNELAGNLTRQVRAIAKVTSAVTSGDLTRSITVDAEGELADLKDNINSMVKSLRETTLANEEQDWLKSNLARISGLMQGHRDLATVAELVLNDLAPLVSAQYGAFFLAEESELELISAYGYPADPDRPTRFRMGETLVGQAARSHQTIAMTDIPAGYITVASGLGRTQPASVVVLPIVVEEQVLGVIELASVYVFTPVHRAFLDQLMETIGVNLNTIVANARTDELLVESQRLTAELQARSEELQNQQEELQHSNAELEEKARLLASQNQDIEAKNLEIEQARQELEDRAQQLSIASKYKSEFLANMSHELRTPLNSLLILAQLLAQNHTRNLTPKQVEYAGIIHSAGSDLLQLINDILDLSKVEAGKMDINPERVSLRHLLEYVEATFQPMTTQKNLDFRITTASGVPVDVVTDDSRLRQVLRNLLSNAVKFTETGSVELRIEPAALSELPVSVRPHGAAVAFRVIDTGIGIPEQQLEVIFGAFQQADGTTSRKYGGTGLGLSISREIAYLLGGAITARSTPGQGSEFTLYLPIARPDFAEGSTKPATAESADTADGQDETHEPAPPRPAPQQRRLLVIEHRPRGLLSLVAESVVTELSPDRDKSIEIVTAEGEEAAATLAAEPCHCIVLDLDMPEQAAYRLLEAMDGDPALRTVPVLAYHNRRAHPQYEADLQARAASQPLELLSGLDELRERIALHLSADQPGDVLPLLRAESVEVAAPEAEVDGSLTGRTVLVVDDDARNLFAITSMLEIHGLRVRHAENGRMGIDALLAHPDIDLVLMDVMMPEMDGYTATMKIREMPEYADLPIITVTAKAMPGDQEKSLAAGASDYVTKPVDADQLITCIRHWMSA